MLFDIKEKKRKGFKYGRGAVGTLFNEKDPIIILADISTKKGEELQRSFKELFSSNFNITKIRLLMKLSHIKGLKLLDT